MGASFRRACANVGLSAVHPSVCACPAIASRRACRPSCVAALIRGQLGISWPYHALGFLWGCQSCNADYAGTCDGAAIAWIARLGAETAGRDGSRRLKLDARHHIVQAANLVVSALRESSMIRIHRVDCCGLQRRESPGLVGLEAESDTDPDVLSRPHQPSALESRKQVLRNVRNRDGMFIIKILMRGNIVT